MKSPNLTKLAKLAHLLLLEKKNQKITRRLESTLSPSQLPLALPGTPLPSGTTTDNNSWLFFRKKSWIANADSTFGRRLRIKEQEKRV